MLRPNDTFQSTRSLNIQGKFLSNPLLSTGQPRQVIAVDPEGIFQWDPWSKSSIHSQHFDQYAEDPLAFLDYLGKQGKLQGP